jgi:hypothetical protein
MISRRQQLLWGALILVTGYTSPAVAQVSWLEITVENAYVLPDFGQTECDAARQQAHGHRVWPGFGDTVTFESSDGPLSPVLGQGEGLIVAQLLADPWWVCSHGWIDLVELRGGGEFFLYGVDADWTPDAASGDVHPGTARIAAVTAWGSLGGFDLASVNGQPATITRTGSTFVVYIGPELAATDFNRDGAVNVPDVFFFLSAFFANQPSADWDSSGVIDPVDLLAYIADWFDSV